jgi:hypothetical protein
MNFTDRLGSRPCEVCGKLRYGRAARGIDHTQCAKITQALYAEKNAKLAKYAESKNRKTAEKYLHGYMPKEAMS